MSQFCSLLFAALQVGVFLQHMTTFIVGFVVAFTRGWDMTLVLVGCLPFLAAIGAVLTQLQTKLASMQTAAYTDVSGCVRPLLLLHKWTVLVVRLYC
jgi:ABC-type multidrug transport system fused ATPase/permease subunit